MKTTIQFALAAAAAISLQAQPAPAPTFAAASVKANHSEARQMGFNFQPGGKLRVVNLPLMMIIAIAYDIPFQSSRLTGGPDWVRADRFDIDAAPEPGAIPAGMTRTESDNRVRAMLQTLLADRFHLKLHREMKDQPVYAIVIAKDGPKLKPSEIEEKDCTAASSDGLCHGFNGGRGRGLHAKACNMADLALFVSNWTDRPVIDKTGLKTLYQFDTRGWSDIRPGPAPAPGTLAEDGQEAGSLPTIFTLFSDMGLKLDSQRAPVEMFTIESVERPSEN